MADEPDSESLHFTENAIVQNFLCMNLIPALEVSSSSLTRTQYSLSPHLLNF